MKVKLASNLKRIGAKKLKGGSLLINLKLFDTNSASWLDELIFELNDGDFEWINIAYKNAIHKRPVAREVVKYGKD